MKKFSVLFIAYLLVFNLYGQTDTAYIYTYGGIQNDVCNQIKPTYDKGYIMIGATNSFGCGYNNFYAIKTDSLGNHQWSKTYGGSQIQEGFSVAPTYDHGYAFLGFTNSYGAGGYDVFLVKTDSAGNEQWQKTYGGSDWDFGYSIQQLPDSGFIICGQTYSYGAGNGDVYIIRTNSVGDTLWTRAVGGAGYDVGNAVCVENDSLYAIVGNTTSFGLGDTNVYFILMDNKGIIKKDTTYGISAISNVGNSISETLDHGFVIFGYTDTNRILVGKPDEMMIQIDSIGKVEWLQVYATSGVGIGKDALQDTDDTYLTVATNNSNGIGGYAMHMQHLNSGGYWMAGPSFGGTGNQEGNSVAIGKNGNVVFAGASNSPGYTQGLYDVYIVRLKNDTMIQNYILSIHNFHDTCLCVSTGVSQVLFYPEVKVFPNPVFSSATVLVQGELGAHYLFDLYSSSGECVIQGATMQSNGHGQSIGHFEKGNFAAGVYIYAILNQSGVSVATGKIIIE